MERCLSLYCFESSMKSKSKCERGPHYSFPHTPQFRRISAGGCKESTQQSFLLMESCPPPEKCNVGCCRHFESSMKCKLKRDRGPHYSFLYMSQFCRISAGDRKKSNHRSFLLMESCPQPENCNVGCNRRFEYSMKSKLKCERGPHYSFLHMSQFCRISVGDRKESTHCSFLQSCPQPEKCREGLDTCTRYKVIPVIKACERARCSKEILTLMARGTLCLALFPYYCYLLAARKRSELPLSFPAAREPIIL